MAAPVAAPGPLLQHGTQKPGSQGLTGLMSHHAAASDYTQTYLIAYSRK